MATTKSFEEKKENAGQNLADFVQLFKCFTCQLVNYCIWQNYLLHVFGYFMLVSGQMLSVGYQMMSGRCPMLLERCQMVSGRCQMVSRIYHMV